MQRVVVVGNSGSGKSTLAARLAQRLAAPHIELDALRHQADWQELPDADFIRGVDHATRGERWVVDGNYPTVRPLIWSRIDTVVWLDPPLHVVMRQVTVRSLRRLLLRKVLWNGNRERWSNLLTTDPERSVIAWAWHNHGQYRQTYWDLLRANRHLAFHRIETRADARALLARAGHRIASRDAPALGSSVKR